MCIIGEGETLLVATTTTAMAPAIPAASASSTGSLQIIKPKLSRKITRSPKINLNKYWNLFENMMAADGADSTIRTRGNRTEFGDPEMNNEINENISNEQREFDGILVRRNNERNSVAGGQRCPCHFCLISDLRNVTVSERSEEVTEL